MMRWITTGILALFLLTGAVSTVFAQDELPPSEPPRALPRLDILAEELDMEREELLDRLQDGQTVAEIADLQGVPLEELAAALMAPQVERLKVAVSDGKLTQEKADERIKLFETRLLESFENSFPPPQKDFKPGELPRRVFDIARKNILEPVLDLLGLTPEKFHSEIQAGKTLQDLADEQGIDLEAFLFEESTARLDEAVEAGKLTREEADERLARLQESLTDGVFDERGMQIVNRWAKRHTQGLLAETLGMTPEELQQALEEGKTIQELAEAQNVDLGEELLNWMEDHRQDRLEDRMDHLRDRMDRWRENHPGGTLP